MGNSCFLSVLWILLSAASTAAGATSQIVQAPQSSSTPPSEIERIGQGRFRIGNILLDKSSQTTPTIIIPAQVNMQKGMIELVACSSGGKLHESIFLADVEPYHMQLALLLLGLNHKGGVKFQGDPAQPEGDRVVIFVEKNGQRRRVEDYVWDLVHKAPMERTDWVFAGSKFLNGEFGAQLTRTLITTYHDPYTILDNPLPTGADDEVYEVNSQVTPPVGTTVTLVIQPVRISPKRKGKEEEK